MSHGSNQSSSHSEHCIPVRLSGFTLVELLVVIGIIALLISILLPSLNKAQRAAKMVACMSNMRQIGQYFMMYASDNKGFLPPIAPVLSSNNGHSVPGVVSNTFPVDNASTGQVTAPGTFDVWSILETYYKLSADSSVLACPQVSADVGAPAIVSANTAFETLHPNAYSTYLYSEILGGQELPPQTGDGWSPYGPTGHGPTITTIGGTTCYVAAPWQLGSIASPSTCAMLIETNTPYWRTTYDWANNINTFFNLNRFTDGTVAPYANHQQLYGLRVAHNAVYQNGSNSDGTHCAIGQGNVLYADGSCQTQIYHQGTVGTNGQASKTPLGWIDGTAADPDYAP